MRFDEWLKLREVVTRTPPTTFRAVILGPSGILTRPLLAGSPKDIANAAAYGVASGIGGQLHDKIFRGAQGPTSAGQILPSDIGRSGFSIEATKTIPLEGRTAADVIRQAKAEIHQEVKNRVLHDREFAPIEVNNPMNPPKFKVMQSPDSVTVIAYYYSAQTHQGGGEGQY